MGSVAPLTVVVPRLRAPSESLPCLPPPSGSGDSAPLASPSGPGSARRLGRKPRKVQTSCLKLRWTTSRSPVDHVQDRSMSIFVKVLSALQGNRAWPRWKLAPNPFHLLFMALDFDKLPKSIQKLCHMSVSPTRGSGPWVRQWALVCHDTGPKISLNGLHQLVVVVLQGGSLHRSRRRSASAERIASCRSSASHGGSKAPCCQVARVCRSHESQGGMKSQGNMKLRGGLFSGRCFPTESRCESSSTAGAKPVAQVPSAVHRVCRAVPGESRTMGFPPCSCLRCHGERECVRSRMQGLDAKQLRSKTARPGLQCGRGVGACKYMTHGVRSTEKIGALI